MFNHFYILFPKNWQRNTDIRIPTADKLCVKLEPTDTEKKYIYKFLKMSENSENTKVETL